MYEIGETFGIDPHDVGHLWTMYDVLEWAAYKEARMENGERPVTKTDMADLLSKALGGE